MSRSASRRRGALAAASLLLFTAATREPWPITNAHPRGSRIVAFGDSLTAGYRVEPGQSYPEHLERLLGRPVLNRGVGGITTAQGLARLDADVLAEEPRIVLVCLGGNDMLRHMSANEQFANLRNIVQAIQARGALVVLIGTEGYKVFTSTDYGARYRALAEETGAVYFPDMLRGVYDDPSLMRDRIHPNGAGNEKIARRMMAELGEYLRR